MANLSPGVSADLKTALLAQTLETFAQVDDTRTFYNGSTLYAAHSGSSGWFLATSNAAPPQHFRTDNTSLVRAWEDFELDILLNYLTGSNWSAAFTNTGESSEYRTCTLTIGEDSFEGEQLLGSLPVEQADLEAKAKAVIAYLNSL